MGASEIFSRFNLIFEREGIYLIYNSLSNSFVELDKESYDLIRKLRPGDIADSLPDSLYEILKRIKGIVTDDSHEIDKIRYISLKNRYNTDRLILTLNPTTSCNFACPYCFEYSHHGKTMTDEVENKIIDFIKSQSGVKELNVTWFGGEPLLAFNRIESLTSKLLALDLNYTAGIITNGYLMTKEIACNFDRLKISRVQITLDGPEDSHNRRRFLKNGGSTFKKIINSIDTLIKCAPTVKVLIRVNIDEENADAFLPLYDNLMERFEGKVSIYPAFTGDSTDKGTTCLFNKQQQQSFMFDIFQKRGLNLVGFYPTMFRSECAVRGQRSYIIGPEGELYSCWNNVGNPDKIYGFVDGKLTNEHELLKFKVTADALENAECQKCLLYPVCSGGCPYERIKRYENGENPNDCPLIKLDIEGFLWNHYLYKTKNNKNVSETDWPSDFF